MPHPREGSTFGRMPGPASPTDVASLYRERIQALEAALARQEEHSARIGTLRLLSFVGALGALLGGSFAGGAARPVPLALFGGAALVFVGLVVRHRTVGERLRRVRALLSVNREGPLRLARDWDALPAPPDPDEPPHHPYASDLDVTGHASLLHLLGTVATAPGRRTLARWLLEPAAPEVATARQEAVAELAPRRDFRDAVAVDGRLMAGDRPAAVEALAAWAGEEPWLLGRTRTLAAALALPLPTVGLAAYDFFVAGGAPWWVLPLAAQLLLVRRHRARIHADYDRLPPESGVRGYVPILGRIEGEEPTSARLRELGGRLGAGAEGSAHSELARLARLMDLAEARHSWLHPVLDVLFHWDIHVHRALERWKVRSGAAVGDWLDALGDVDALSALGTLAHDNPDWCLARFHDEPVVRARALGHPLLPPARCVRNDVEVGAPGSFLLVTGSNMSGKSTLLRAIGVDVVLAQAGGPACAAELHLPGVRLWTSMRVMDSLEEGVSQFMAELHRLRDLVVEARPAAADGDRPLLYLLDEMLQGTNSAERQVAARTVLRHLLARDALGVVSTHDLKLADAPDLQKRARVVHFRETVSGAGGDRPALTFDYRLRPGLATSTNALRLMDMMGLAAEADAAGRG